MLCVPFGIVDDARSPKRWPSESRARGAAPRGAPPLAGRDILERQRCDVVAWRWPHPRGRDRSPSRVAIAPRRYVGASITSAPRAPPRKRPSAASSGGNESTARRTCCPSASRNSGRTSRSSALSCRNRTSLAHPYGSRTESQSGRSTVVPESSCVESLKYSMRPSVTNEWQRGRPG